MIQKCNYLRVLEIFFKEPTTLHFIREISRRIDLAMPSVRNYINELEKENLIIKRKAKPFDGYVANRENYDFVFSKRVYNLYSVKGLNKFLVESLWPKAIVLFGSYSKGEDVESSDIDILVITKVKKELNLKKFEKELGRKISLLFVEDLNQLEKNMIKKIHEGILLYGGLNG